jgi:hypothetical protein
MPEYRKYREYILLAVIWFALGNIVFPRYNSIDANTCTQIIMISTLHGLLYKNPVFHRINVVVGLLMMLAIQLIFNYNVWMSSLIVSLLLGILLISFFNKKKSKNADKHE